MKTSIALLLTAGCIASFGSGLWLSRCAASTSSSPAAEPSNARATTAPPKPTHSHRAALAVPTNPREWSILLDEIGPVDVPHLLTAALAIRDTSERRSTVQRLLEIWALEAPADAFSWLSRHQQIPSIDLGPIFEAWGEHDPAAAIAGLATITDRHAGWRAAAGLCDAWTRSDPTGAMAWAKDLPPSEIRNNALNSICSVLAERDTQQAVAFALSLGDSAGAANRLSGIVRIQAATDPQAALRTINSLPAGVPRGPLCRQIVDALVAEDPRLAGAFALTIPPSEAQRGALQTVASRLAVDSVQTALDWINSTIPSGPIRGNVMENTLVIAAQANPKAVAPLVATLRGNLFRHVAMNLAINWVRSDPQATTAWVDQLPADRNRAFLQQTLFDSWLRADPAAAAAWLATTDLPEETKQQLLSAPR
ncbi:MAG TPA: hypothetical protein VK163_08470 [Opitutaceae bacterium]|nr:hypothetical protein [Opitutaceae bacterium]